jgi:hypothetical protein
MSEVSSAEKRVSDHLRQASNQAHRSWEVALHAGYELIEFPAEDWPEGQRRRVSEAAHHVCICFGQQMLVGDPSKSPRTTRKLLEKLRAKADR